MRNCAKGAIVSSSEMGVFGDAVELAIEYVEIDLDSNRVHARDKTREEAQVERHNRRLLQALKVLHRKLRKLGHDRPRIKLVEVG